MNREIILEMNLEIIQIMNQNFGYLNIIKKNIIQIIITLYTNVVKGQSVNELEK